MALIRMLQVQIYRCVLHVQVMSFLVVLFIFMSEVPRNPEGDVVSVLPFRYPFSY